MSTLLRHLSFLSRTTSFKSATTTIPSFVSTTWFTIVLTQANAGLFRRVYVLLWARPRDVWPFKPRPLRSTSTYLIILLLLLCGDVSTNSRQARPSASINPRPVGPSVPIYTLPFVSTNSGPPVHPSRPAGTPASISCQTVYLD